MQNLQWLRGFGMAFATFLGCLVLALWAWPPSSELQVSSNVMSLEENMSQQSLSNEFVSLGFGTVCRSSVEDFRTVPQQGRVRNGVPLEECRSLCSADKKCKGLEFRRGEMRCEMWHEEISAHRHVFHNRTVPGAPDFECILKSPSCQRIKVHKALHDIAIMDLSFFVADYCEYGPTSPELDACSRFYAEQMYVINHRLCGLVTKECGSATCDETQSEII